MKKLVILLVILTTVSVIFLTGCDKKSNPVSFVDDYSVTLTEDEGATYSGD